MQQIIGKIKTIVDAGHITVDQLQHVGDLAQKAIKNKSVYPIVKKTAIKFHLLSDKDFAPGVDYQALGKLVTIGYLAGKVSRI